MKKPVLIIIVLLFVLSCKSEKKPDQIELATEELTESEEEWTYLFDGTSTDGWRAYNGEKMPPQWVVKDGTLTFDTEKRLESEKKGGNDIIYAAQQFDNFELYVEWKIPEGGNSGIFYHIQEGDWGVSEVAPEYQLLDDLKWEEINGATLEDWQKTGAAYAMYSADEELKLVKPAGEWNTSRIRFTTNLVEYWLNGQMTVSFRPWSKDWEQRKVSGKWKDFPKHGTFKKGYIGLQDHDSPLWFKNIKIKKL